MANLDNLKIHAFFDEPTHTVTYLVWDAASRKGAVDSVTGRSGPSA